MSFLFRIVRLLFWLLIVSWSVGWLRRALSWALRSSRQKPAHDAVSPAVAETPGTSRRLVRDPVCGVHIAELLSIPLREGGQLLHFCSAACRDQYVRGTEKFAASG